MHHHGAGLRKLIKDDTLVQALINDYATASINDADRAMLSYVDKLTRTPSDMSKNDVTELSKAGFHNAAILDICQVAAYYAFVNRLADGLGIELENQPGPEQ